MDGVVPVARVDRKPRLSNPKGSPREYCSPMFLQIEPKNVPSNSTNTTHQLPFRKEAYHAEMERVLDAMELDAFAETAVQRLKDRGGNVVIVLNGCGW